MVGDKYDKLRRQNRRIVIFLFALFVSNVVLMLVFILGKDHRQNFVAVNGVAGITPIKGVDYSDGTTPIKGVDYFDGRNGYTPIKGIDYFDGKTPAKGIDYFDGKDGYTPIKGVDYNDGEKGDPGPALEMRCNTETQQFETRVPGDDLWHPVEGSDCVAGHPH